MKKIFHILINLIFTLIIAILGTLLVSSALGYKSYIVMSGSMEPNIHTGSIAIVDTNFPYNNITVGDVIAFKEITGMSVTHRVTQITDEGMITKGDNNDVEDGVSTNKSNYLGKTFMSISFPDSYLNKFDIEDQKNIGHYIMEIENRYGETNAKIVIGFFLFSLFLLDTLIYDEKKEKAKKKEKKKAKKALKESRRSKDKDIIEAQSHDEIKDVDLKELNDTEEITQEEDKEERENHIYKEDNKDGKKIIDDVDENYLYCEFGTIDEYEVISEDNLMDISSFASASKDNELFSPNINDYEVLNVGCESKNIEIRKRK